MGIIAFILILKSILNCCPCFVFITDVAIKDAVYVLFREVVIVLCGAIILEALIYYNIIQYEKQRSVGLTYCILLTLIIWTLLGFFLVLKA